MKTTDFIKEGYIADDADAMHKDHEVQMARQDCYNAAKNAIELHGLLKNISEMQGLEGWVSEKLTLAADYLKTVKEYLEYNMMSANESEPTFSFESAEHKYSAILDEAVLGGAKQGGPTSTEEYKRMLGDVYDLMSQDKDPANRDIYNQKIADLKRVAKERGLIEGLTDADVAKIRADAEARLKTDIDKQSDARIAALKNPPKEKSFMQKVGDKQIGMVKGAWKGLTQGSKAVGEDAGMGGVSAGGTTAGSIAAVTTPLMKKKVIKRK